MNNKSSLRAEKSPFELNVMRVTKCLKVYVNNAAKYINYNKNMYFIPESVLGGKKCSTITKGAAVIILQVKQKQIRQVF